MFIHCISLLLCHSSIYLSVFLSIYLSIIDHCLSKSQVQIAWRFTFKQQRANPQSMNILSHNHDTMLTLRKLNIDATLLPTIQSIFSFPQWSSKCLLQTFFFFFNQDPTKDRAWHLVVLFIQSLGFQNSSLAFFGLSWHWYLKTTGHLFCAMSVNSDLFDCFLWLISGSTFFGKNAMWVMLRPQWVPTRDATCHLSRRRWC